MSWVEIEELPIIYRRLCKINVVWSMRYIQIWKFNKFLLISSIIQFSNFHSTQITRVVWPKKHRKNFSNNKLAYNLANEITIHALVPTINLRLPKLNYLLSKWTLLLFNLCYHIKSIRIRILYLTMLTILCFCWQWWWKWNVRTDSIDWYFEGFFEGGNLSDWECFWHSAGLQIVGFKAVILENWSGTLALYV